MKRVKLPYSQKKINLKKSFKELSLNELYNLETFQEVGNEYNVWEFEHIDGSTFYTLTPEFNSPAIAETDSGNTFNLQDGTYFSINPKGSITVKDSKIVSYSSHEVILSYLKSLIYFLSDFSLNEVYSLDIRDIEQTIAKELVWYEKELPYKKINKFKIDGITYKAPESFLDMKMIQWATIEADLLNSGALENLYEKRSQSYIVYLLSCCFTNTYQSFNSQEDSKKIIDRNQNTFKNLDVETAFHAATHCLEQIEAVKKEYKRLFESKPESESKSNAQEAWDNYYKRGGWLGIMEILGYEISKYSEKNLFWSSRVEDIFNAMVMLEDKNKARELEQKEKENQNK